MKRFVSKIACFVSLFLPFVPSLAQTGTLTTNVSTWKGISRTWMLYVPQHLANPPAAVVCLHGTTLAPLSRPPLNHCFAGMGWNLISDASGVIVIAPIASWKPSPGRSFGGWFFWQSYGTDAMFPSTPDDSGFIRSLMLQVGAQYGVSQFGVMGFSSGGMMTHRVAIENSDLVSAAAPLSGTVWVGVEPSVPFPQYPVSIFELHGDADTTIGYCGGKFAGWGSGSVVIPAVDADMQYWQQADGLVPNFGSLCANGVPSALTSLDAQQNGVEVKFSRELGYGHTYKYWTIAAVWEFLASHWRQL